MKTRLFLLVTLITAQLAWLGWQYNRSASELASARRIVVKATPPTDNCVASAEPLLYQGKPYNEILYHLDRRSQEMYRLVEDNAEELTFTLEIALREKQPPIATAFFVNGLPIAQVVEQIRQSKLPLPAVTAEAENAAHEAAPTTENAPQGSES